MPNLLPADFAKNLSGWLDYNKLLIENTRKFCCCYKINFAFYEAYGPKGMEILEKTLSEIPQDIVTIADAKRGDIGNTAKAYAISFFDYYGFDAVTINPYMGMESAEPYFNYENKIVFILGITSNIGSNDIQKLKSSNKYVFEIAVEKFVNRWPNSGFVAGGTRPDDMINLRRIAPKNLLLIPGIGAQGGNIENIAQANNHGPAIINVSRSINYPSGKGSLEENFYNSAKEYNEKINQAFNNMP